LLAKVLDDSSLLPEEAFAMKTINCPCGEVVEAETDDQLVQSVEKHIEKKHPDMVGKYSKDQILNMATAK
jgi:hypothetical protein